MNMTEIWSDKEVDLLKDKVEKLEKEVEKLRLIVNALVDTKNPFTYLTGW